MEEKQESDKFLAARRSKRWCGGTFPPPDFPPPATFRMEQKRPPGDNIPSPSGIKSPLAVLRPFIAHSAWQ